LLVMDGSLKKIGYKYEEEGFMFKEELTVRSVAVDEDALLDSKEANKEEEEDLDLATEMEMEELPKEEEMTDLEMVKEEVKEEKLETKVEKRDIGEFLDLMEVF